MVNWTIHLIADDQDLPPMFATLPGDGSNGLLIGELDEVHELANRLNQFLADRQTDGNIDHLDERLGHRWLSVSEASAEWGIPISSITLACRNQQIRHAEKRGRDWRFPQATFLAWLAKRPGRGNLQG